MDRNPESIQEYMAKGGYEGLKKCIQEMTPEGVIEEIKVSGLAGRGGAGFPTWFKWNAARNAKGDQKYVICNADEGDPGAFMDRSILEGDPHTLIEGMCIAAYAIGANGRNICKGRISACHYSFKESDGTSSQKWFLRQKHIGNKLQFRFENQSWSRCLCLWRRNCINSIPRR